jgi:hypothetical protein
VVLGRHKGNGPFRNDQIIGLKKGTTINCVFTFNLNDFDIIVGTLLGLMHSTGHSEVQLKIEVLNALLKVFELDPRTRAVFREVGGFVYVMSVPLNMEGSLITPPKTPWDKGEYDMIFGIERISYELSKYVKFVAVP